MRYALVSLADKSMHSHAAFRASARSVGLAGGHGGGQICPREVSARRSASGGRCRPAMCPTRSAA